MQTGTADRYSSEIDKSERKMLAEVLKHYDFYVDSADKVRSAYIIRTNKGVFCLKRVSHGYKKAKKSFFIMRYLKERGFDNLAEYYCTKTGKALVKHRGDAFYLTGWIDGREASFKSVEEILSCSEFLAHFHNMAKGFNEEKHVKVKSHVKKWSKSFKKFRNEMEGYKEYIDKLKLKAEFDYIYRSNIEHFCKEADFAVKILEHSRYNELCDYYSNEGYICHDSFYYQNIIINREGRLYLVDLESCQYDIPVSDLGKLIRRVLSKKRFKWDFDLCRRMIDSYCKVRQMPREEYELLLAVLVFPHKFWKLGKKRYVNEKKWNEEKYGKKLKRLLRERKYKSEFINYYISFYGLDLDYEPDIVD